VFNLWIVGKDGAALLIRFAGHGKNSLVPKDFDPKNNNKAVGFKEVQVFGCCLLTSKYLWESNHFCLYHSPKESNGQQLTCRFPGLSKRFCFDGSGIRPRSLPF